MAKGKSSTPDEVYIEYIEFWDYDDFVEEFGYDPAAEAGLEVEQEHEEDEDFSRDASEGYDDFDER